MDTIGLLFECSELFKKALNLYVRKADEIALNFQLSSAKEIVEKLLSDDMIASSLNLKKILVAVERGLIRAIANGPYSYFEKSEDLVNLADAFVYIVPRLNLDLTEENYTKAYERLSVTFPDILDEMAEEDFKKEIPRDYFTKFRLESGASLKIRMFNQSEHAWTFKYHYYDAKEKKIGENPAILNDLSLFVGYKDGISGECKLSMHIIVPDKFEEKYLLGEAISPHDKLFLEFIYEKTGARKEAKYKLARVEMTKKGLHILDLKNAKEGLMQPLDFPFFVPDEIEYDGYEFEVPFQKTDGTDSAFVFPEDIRVGGIILEE